MAAQCSNESVCTAQQARRPRSDHWQPKLNIREPLNYKDFYGNTTDLCKMVEIPGIFCSIGHTISPDAQPKFLTGFKNYARVF